MSSENNEPTKQPLSAKELETIARAVETRLGNQNAGPIQIAELVQISEPERRNLLLRATLDNPPPGLPNSLIVKKVVAEKGYDPDDATAWDTRRFFQDWAGAAFLSQCAPGAGHSPHFYGGDRNHGFILLEDLGDDHNSLVEPLLGSDAAAAEQALLRFTERLAHMHLDTAGRADEFYALVEQLNPQLADQMRSGAAFAQQRANTIAQLAALDINIPDAATSDLDMVAAALAAPGPFRAYLHGDPCPDNFFWQGATLRLIDFELGYMGHALCDLAYGRTYFPTCWCCNRVPDWLVGQMEARYRQIVGAHLPAVLDDAIFGRAMTVACAYWLISSLNWLLEPVLEEDRTWGIAQVRPRLLARLEVFIAASQEFDHLPGLCDLAVSVLAVLQNRWPALEPLPVYPALREQPNK